MKEATAELGNTLVVVVSVAILIAFFYFVVWPMIDNNFKSQTSCDKAVCEAVPNSDGTVDCIVKTKTFYQFLKKAFFNKFYLNFQIIW